MDKLLLGIDFGTSTNFVTRYDFRRKDAVEVENMGNYGDSNIFENCIYIENENNFVLGDKARSRQYTDPENFFDDIKRFIVDDNKRYKIPNLKNRIVTPSDIAEMIFETIKKKVETNYNQKIDGVVITIPYSYGKKYREKIKKIATNAGLNVIQLVEEPVAAAISYGIFGDEVENNKKEKIVVFDLGGGTLDITIFNFEKNNNQNIRVEVLNTDGVINLGGKTIDEILVKKFMEHLNIDYSIFSKEKERIKFQNEISKVAKETKERLSEEEEVDVYETFIINGELKELDLEISIDEFNEWLKNNNILGEIEDALERAIYDIDLKPEDIDRVILAGGTSSIPIIKEKVEEFFGKKIKAKKNLGELVGHGAGILAGLSEDNSLNYKVIRKTSKHIGVAIGNKFKKILYKNTKYGEESAKVPLRLKNRDDELIVNFYEGDSKKIERCEIVGKITINRQIINSDKIYISLMREDNRDTKIKVFFYDADKNLIFEKYLEEV